MQSESLQDRFFAHPKIEVIWNAEVAAFLGKNEPSPRLTGLRLRDRITGNRENCFGGWCIRRDRSRPGHGTLSRSTRHDEGRLHQDRALVYGNLSEECLVGTLRCKR